MKGIKVEITLTRTIYIDSPGDTITDADKSEIILPHNVMIMANNALMSARINIPKLDISDWDVKNLEYTLLKNEDDKSDSK